MSPTGLLGAASTAPISNAGGVLLLSKFHIAALAFQRVRQIQSGARPRVDSTGHKPVRVALLEVMTGAVSWSVT